ncbi:VCBS repeat-containing protein [Fulvivirgaceae bacterium BMA12]|uniref:VCBS repeat-containing protein n=1 Tax=Agaribacillus aureus TaxID=3051825 RepID=A0ABT8L6L3_9BACT|nr:VCBS repeat-containing protein [Fulvivirgaceae bacterium BMA12]
MTYLTGCHQETEYKAYHGPLFRLLPPEKTAITFQNELPESPYMNRFVYEYFYNGGGVAIGDVNNDGLEDIYFTANLGDNKLYLNKGGLVFEDITSTAKVAGKKGWATGVTMVDINQDGLLDIYVSRAGRFTDAEKRKNELFINQGTSKEGKPVFRESAADYGLDDEAFTNQASFFDYDRDGDLDVFLANHNIEAPPVDIKLIRELRQADSPLGGNKLMANHNGIFSDVTGSSGMLSHGMNYTLNVSIGDVNNDNWPDIYVANDYSEPDHLYINNRDGTFKDAIQTSVGHMPNFSMGSDIADINNDGFPDIMTLDMVAEDNYGIKTSMSGMNTKLFNDHVNAGLHYQYMYNALQLNKGTDANGLPFFSDIAQIAGVSNTDWSWAPLLADFDNDGFKDIFITNGIKRDFRNNDFNIFLRKATQEIIDEQKNPLKYYAQWTRFSPMRSKVNYVYRNKGDLSFTDVSDDWGMRESSYSNGAAYADLDNDGDLDLVVNNVDAPAFIYENLADKHKSHHFLSIVLKGPESNRMGIGVRISLVSNGNRQHLEHYPVRGYQSSVSGRLHFGLGNSTKVEELIVRWPDGKYQKLQNIKADQQLILHYREAQFPAKREDAHLKAKLFEDVTDEAGIAHFHKENTFDDFERESLLPHKMSTMGPALAVGDINNDGLEDFYVGGAAGYGGELYIQNHYGGFTASGQKLWKQEKKYEDVDALFFDADNDSDVDLYVVSGGNEYNEGSKYYQSRLYENLGNGNFKRAKGTHELPLVSGSVVRHADFDNDGDQDLFVGGRQKPGMYPHPVSSFLLRNDSEEGSINFTDITSEVIPGLNNIGMVTDALWTDLDRDQLPDLLICGEWMSLRLFKNRSTRFEDVSANTGLDNFTGWWHSIAATDFDKDGDIDFIAGNNGLNSKYKASEAEPFEIFAGDMDNNGSHDIVLGYYNDGTLFPLRGRECSSGQMPFVKEKFKSYEAFGNATLFDVYGREKLSGALHYQVNTFATTYFENEGNTKFRAQPLDNMAQLSVVNCLLIDDCNKDGYPDIVLAGNRYETEVETPRQDAGYGLFMKGDSLGDLQCVDASKAGLFVDGNIKKGTFINLSDGSKGILFARNNGPLKMIRINAVSL